ncbi:MAG TPA: SDR family NAD(P)-dependent oxidoreductase [Spirochaetia bacterium]|nr:SDR family NAD(P)-dependent oxidoreductase [Spirochaetia bacterium]
MKITGNVVLITGATAGIGRELAERFAALGNKVIACGRRAERLQELKSKYPDIVTRQCDISDPEQRSAIAKWVAVAHPDLNVLINNAGIQLAVDLTRPVELEDLRLEIETNLTAPLHLGSLLVGLLAGKPAAAIINISSGLAFSPIAFMPVYCATKAAVHSYTLSLRHQLRESTVRVFEIAPPSVDTELGHQRRTDASASHGGMPVDELVTEVLRAIEGDRFEAAIGPAENMHRMREELFARMNGG